MWPHDFMKKTYRTYASPRKTRIDDEERSRVGGWEGGGVEERKKSVNSGFAI